MGKKNKNPFLSWIPYAIGFSFATVFLIMFFSSQITQGVIGGLSVDEVTAEIEAQFITVCENSGLPLVDVDLCISTVQDSLQEARDSIGTQITEEIGFFPSLFFQPSASGVALTVIILFLAGFLFSWIFMMLMR